MHHSKSYELLPLDLQIKQTCRQNRNERREERHQAFQQPQEAMDDAGERNNDNRALRDYALPKVIGIKSMIRKLTIQANNFEIKPATL